MDASPMAGWDNFYVIAGSAAAGLTGLTFLLIALARDAVGGVRPTGLNAFVTPTIVHFSGVLALAGYVSMPHHNVTSLSIGFGVGGLAGVVYGGAIAVRMSRQGSAYVPVREDWIWNVILPTLAYVGFAVMAALIWKKPTEALYGVAALTLSLLLIGIRNAWDIAVWMALYRKRETPSAQG